MISSEMLLIILTKSFYSLQENRVTQAQQWESLVLIRVKNLNL